MTFNATDLDLSVLAGHGLVEWELRHIPTKPVRRLFMTPEILDLLDGVDGKPELSPTKASALADRFVAEHVLWVSRKMGDKRPSLERLVDLDEVWALCVREPKPGWRFFGRFLHQDVLVLLKAHARRDLAPKSFYATKAAEVVQDWKARLPLLEPLRGDKIGDYLSGEKWNDLDEDN